MTVEELLARISSRELTEWMAYDRLEPFGPRRADLRAALITWAIAEVHRNRDEKKEPFKLEDFMLTFEPPAGDDEEDEPVNITAMRTMMEWMTVALGGQDLRGQD